MTAWFARVAHADGRLLARAELHFDEKDGPLAGLSLRGFEIWFARDGTRLEVIYPHKPRPERGAYVYLRPVNGVAGLQSAALTTWLIREYRQWLQADALSRPTAALDPEDPR